MQKKIKKINQQLFNNYINYDTKHQKCIDCKIVKGMYIFSPIYYDWYLKYIYNQLEKTFNNNKNDPSFTYQDGKNRIFIFDNMNLIDIVKYTHHLNHNLGIIIKKNTLHIQLIF